MKAWEDREAVREVLADHFIMWHHTEGSAVRGEWRCSCGLKFGFSDSAIDHQADRIVPITQEDAP